VSALPPYTGRQAVLNGAPAREGSIAASSAAGPTYLGAMAAHYLDLLVLMGAAA